MILFPLYQGLDGLGHFVYLTVSHHIWPFNFLNFPHSWPLLVSQLGLVPWTQALIVKRSCSSSFAEPRAKAQFIILLSPPPCL